MKKFLLALQFLTRFPVSFPDGIEQEVLGKSTVYFPFVGLILGALLVLSNAVLSLFLPGRLVNAGLVVLLTFFTGALHLDGFADTVDAFFSKTRDREEILRIMRDSHLGAVGAVFLVLLLLAKIELLGALPLRLKNVSLLLMCLLSRWSLVISCTFSGYARSSGGIGHPFVEYTGKRECFFAALFVFLLANILLFPYGNLPVVLTFFTALGLVRYIRAKIGGVTGDTLGAVNETIEMVVLIVMLLMGKFILTGE